MRKGLIRLSTLMAMLFFLSAACAPKAAPAPTPVALTPAPGIIAPVPKVSAKPTWEAEWEKLVTAAQKEGRLMAYASGAIASRAVAADFKNKYGINLDVVVGRGAELAAKLFMERRAGIYTTDLWLGGATTLVEQFRPAGVLAPLEPTFVLPELTDPELIKKTWWKGELPWVDPEGTIFPYTAYPSGQYGVNTSMVKPGEMKGWKDLLDPKWKGKIVINDPTVAGSGALCFAVLVHKIMGVDYMRELVKQEPIVVRDQRLMVEWVAKGKYPILISGKNDMIDEFQRAGAPLQVILPEEGMYITAGDGNISLIKDARHPNAAKLFANYLLTREGQTIYSIAYNAQSARVDVPVNHLESYGRRQPGMKYFDSNELEFKLKMNDYMKLAKEIFAPVMK